MRQEYIGILILVVMFLIYYYYFETFDTYSHQQLIRGGENTSNTDINSTIYMIDELEKVQL